MAAAFWSPSPEQRRMLRQQGLHQQQQPQQQHQLHSHASTLQVDSVARVDTFSSDVSTGAVGGRAVRVGLSSTSNADCLAQPHCATGLGLWNSNPDLSALSGRLLRRLTLAPTLLKEPEPAESMATAATETGAPLVAIAVLAPDRSAGGSKGARGAAGGSPADTALPPLLQAPPMKAGSSPASHGSVSSSEDVKVSVNVAERTVGRGNTGHGFGEEGAGRADSGDARGGGWEDREGVPGTLRIGGGRRRRLARRCVRDTGGSYWTSGLRWQRRRGSLDTLLLNGGTSFFFSGVPRRWTDRVSQLENAQHALAERKRVAQRTHRLAKLLHEQVLPFHAQFGPPTAGLPPANPRFPLQLTRGEYVVTIVTTACLPWLTGTSINPLLRSAFLCRMYGARVVLLVPWISPADQQVVHPAHVFQSQDEQAQHVHEWVEKRLGYRVHGLQCRFYEAWYDPRKGSVFPIDRSDVTECILDSEADVAILEEPEHLCWYHLVGPKWRTKFWNAVGIIHTNYLEYIRRDLVYGGPRVAFLLWFYNCLVVRANCHSVVRLSAAVQWFPNSCVENVHGVSPQFLHPSASVAHSQCASEDDCSVATRSDATRNQETVYFVGKILWGKGYRELCDLLLDHCQRRRQLQHGQQELQQQDQNHGQNGHVLLPDISTEALPPCSNASNNTGSTSSSSATRKTLVNGTQHLNSAAQAGAGDDAAADAETAPQSSLLASSTLLLSSPSHSVPPSSSSSTSLIRRFLQRFPWSRKPAAEAAAAVAAEAAEVEAPAVLTSGVPEANIARRASPRDSSESSAPAAAVAAAAAVLGRHQNGHESKGGSPEDATAGLLVHVYGSGPDEVQVKEFAARHKLPMVFHGRKDHADPDIRRYKVFVNPSLSDVLCTTTAEAAAMGKLLVLCRHPSNEFFMHHFGENCITYDPHDPKDFSRALGEALSREPKLLSNVQHRVVTWEAATERFMKLAGLDYEREPEPISPGFRAALNC